MVRLLLHDHTMHAVAQKLNEAFWSAPHLKTIPADHTMTQACLNHLAIFHVHQLESHRPVRLVAIAQELVSKCETRFTTFGQQLRSTAL